MAEVFGSVWPAIGGGAALEVRPAPEAARRVSVVAAPGAWTKPLVSMPGSAGLTKMLFGKVGCVPGMTTTCGETCPSVALPVEEGMPPEKVFGESGCLRSAMSYPIVAGTMPLVPMS
ncbi:MAG TPA: hypothetical protein HPQ04_14505, partial [Rhodospirillaceae bacterium]|nr:hypothetical protein [Rhodospirillaceae bacterium]